MEKEQNEKANKYNEHAKFLADIALAVLDGNKSVLDVNGVKEIIALYLLVPYITHDSLPTPGPDYVIPKIDECFYNDITYRNLRDSICHSFVTIEEDKNDGSPHGKNLIFDDRITCPRTRHCKEPHSTAYGIPKSIVHDKLIEVFRLIEEQ